jgi:hypothetical protein
MDAVATRVDTFLDAPHTNALDGRAIDLQRLGDGVVGPARPSYAFVRLEQDPRVRKRARGRFAAA